MRLGTHRWIESVPHARLEHVNFRVCQDCGAELTQSEQGSVQTSGEEICPSSEEVRPVEDKS